MRKKEKDPEERSLNELLDELEKSVNFYCPQNKDFAFTHPLPQILRLLAQAIAELQANSLLPSTTNTDRSSILGHPGEDLEKGSGIID